MSEQESVFTAIKTQKLYAQIVKQIVDLIEKGDFPAGTQLPPERDLARQLGVSRASLREALTVLQMRGWVETKTGQGTFVASQPVSPFSITEVSRLNEGESPFSIIQARKVIEPAIAAFAAGRRSEAALRSIAETLDQMRLDNAAVQVASDTFSEGDREFHFAIARATENLILIMFQSTFRTMMGQRLWKTLMRESSWSTPGRWQEAIAEHSSILDAIRSQDEQLAFARSRAHLERVETLMAEAELVSFPGGPEPPK